MAKRKVSISISLRETLSLFVLKQYIQDNLRIVIIIITEPEMFLMGKSSLFDTWPRRFLTISY